MLSVEKIRNLKRNSLQGQPFLKRCCNKKNTPIYDQFKEMGSTISVNIIVANQNPDFGRHNEWCRFL